MYVWVVKGNLVDFSLKHFFNEKAKMNKVAVNTKISFLKIVRLRKKTREKTRTWGSLGYSSLSLLQVWPLLLLFISETVIIIITKM